MMSYSSLFWLHIKKSAGCTTRSLLSPYYVQVDRQKPKTFIQATPDEYNDILNNFRVLLGEYQFKRCLFAKQYLYKDRWDSMFSFAFAREPIDRCISMFFYVYWKEISLFKKLTRALRAPFTRRRLPYNTRYAFDTFLDCVREARESNSIYRPVGNRFTTHTAPMWEDITDLEGNVLLKAIFRVEDLAEGINCAFEACGIQKRIGKNELRLNKNNKRTEYVPTRAQVKKIENIYHRDCEIYEKRCIVMA
jgi:hypothetical protein